MYETLVEQLREIALHVRPSENAVLNDAADVIESFETRRVKKFKPPTLAEVEAYAQSRGKPQDAKLFWEYFNAGNWIDSEGKPVKSWKQKFITWENKDKRKVKKKVLTFMDL